LQISSGLHENMIFSTETVKVGSDFSFFFIFIALFTSIYLGLYTLF
jgi:hypothetical protein